MKIIGEKINGTRTQIAKAIAARDAELIQSLARRQVEAGASWLDVNAGTHPEKEPADLVWLIDTVQAVVDLPLCLDSANPAALAAAIKATRHTPIINSISGEPQRFEGVLPIVAEHGCPVIALCMDDKGIPATAEARLNVMRRVVDAAHRAGVRDENIYIDSLVMTIGTNTQAGNVVLDTMRAVHAEWPAAHLNAGLSNVSFGLPARALVNRTFLVMAMAAGLDTAIADPLDRDLRAAMLAADLLLGHDKHCLGYTRAYRAGWLEKVEKAA